MTNFPVNSQFITNCTQAPNTSWHTIAQCAPITDNLYQCYLGSREIWIVDLLVRIITVSFLPLFVALTIKNYFKINNRSRENEETTVNQPYYQYNTTTRDNDFEFPTIHLDSELDGGKNFGIKFFVALITISFVISIALIQYKGLDTTGLESICNINPELLSSKTGYLVE